MCSVAHAVRPFITDDARVVGWRLFQWESWLRMDVAGMQSWHMFAYGPHKNVELSLGMVGGGDFTERPSLHATFAAPLLQIKFLLREYKPNKAPGVAFSMGSFLPYGRGATRPPGYGAYSILMLTQSFFKNDGVLIHGNIGGNYLRIDKQNDLKLIWGLGTQIRMHGGFHFVGEVFSGDPYVAGAGTAVQAGMRYFVSDLLQLDMTIGNGLGGTEPMPVWISGGVRWVTEYFYRKRNKKQHVNF
ncbi:MAG: transporter [Chitinophagales bacterium]|nr:transporter [Chitinophagales bacterium]MDW8418263.1 hypothetical protein [Chitinophagales bacterium]